MDGWMDLIYFKVSGCRCKDNPEAITTSCPILTPSIRLVWLWWVRIFHSGLNLGYLPLGQTAAAAACVPPINGTRMDVMPGFLIIHFCCISFLCLIGCHVLVFTLSWSPSSPHCPPPVCCFLLFLPRFITRLAYYSTNVPVMFFVFNPEDFHLLCCCPDSVWHFLDLNVCLIDSHVHINGVFV